jgi:hypothetical protein
MRVYHRTDRGEAILRDGFRDGEGSYGTRTLYRGVWVSSGSPLDENEGAAGDGVVLLEIPDELFRAFEWIEEGKPYREALVPASELNRHLGTARLYS